MDLRCPHKLFGVLESGLIEFKCNSNRCGAGPGVVVLHYFTPEGELVDTKQFKDPRRIAHDRNSPPVRDA
jgi:hypothetical protein